MKQGYVAVTVFLFSIFCKKKKTVQLQGWDSVLCTHTQGLVPFHNPTSHRTQVCADHKCGKTVKENHERVPGVSLGSFISHNRAWISARVFLASSSSSHKVITSSLTPTPSFNEGMPSPLPRPWGELVLSTSMDWEKLSKLSSYSLGIE